MPNENIKAFPYKPPSIQIKQKYSYIFANQFSLQNRYLKLVFDKLIALLFLLITLPIIIFLKLAFIIEGLLIPENKGPMFFSYNAVLKAKSFQNIKSVLLKQNTSNPKELNEATGLLTVLNGMKIQERLSVPLLKNSTSMRSLSFGMC